MARTRALLGVCVCVCVGGGGCNTGLTLPNNSKVGQNGKYLVKVGKVADPTWQQLVKG